MSKRVAVYEVVTAAGLFLVEVEERWSEASKLRACEGRRTHRWGVCVPEVRSLVACGAIAVDAEEAPACTVA